MNAKEDRLMFGGAKSIYANKTIVGIALDGSDGVSYGYDGGINLPEDRWAHASSRLTAAECVELADAMIERWAAFRAKYSKAG